MIIECGEETNLAALQMVMFASGGIAESFASEIMTTAEAAQAAKDAAKLLDSYRVPEQ